MKKIYNKDINLYYSIRVDNTETICVVDDKGNADFYHVVFNPQFKDIDDFYIYAYVFEELGQLIDYFSENDKSNKHKAPNCFGVREFKTESEYIKWFNNLSWI